MALVPFREFLVSSIISKLLLLSFPSPNNKKNKAIKNKNNNLYLLFKEKFFYAFEKHKLNFNTIPGTTYAGSVGVLKNKNS